MDYCGFIFFGLINVNNEPYVIEYNCRMGDPEAESVIPRINNDLLQIFRAVADKQLEKEILTFRNECTATVMLVSKGYPEQYEKGKVITGEDAITDSLVFHAGTRFDPGSSSILTNGGRVIAVTSFGPTIHDALNTSNRNAAKIRFEGKYYRNDIGFDL